MACRQLLHIVASFCLKFHLLKRKVPLVNRGITNVTVSALSWGPESFPLGTHHQEGTRAQMWGLQVRWPAGPGTHFL